MAPMPPSHSTVDMFNNAQNNNFHNNSFVTNVKAAPALEKLYNRVAPNAILNAGGRADVVRCHPGTREEVIDRIEKWADAQDDLMAPMFWLSGPAGAGKSAIMQTVAERRDQRALPEANFFFFRGDTSRNHASALVATLLHQIVLFYPSLQNVLATLLSTNALIFNTALETQLDKLIFTPLREIQQSSSTHQSLVLLIDGLDECGSETKDHYQQILLAFDKLFKRHPTACPVRLLVASRDEPQIHVAFNKIASQCTKLYLDDQYSPAKDIRVFVEAQCAEVRKTHRIGRTLGAGWPSVHDVNYIVEKSSGQFIYPSTVMRFISGSSASPILSLDRVRGAEKFATKSPFSHLDGIYTYILSQAEDQTTLKKILQAHILLRELLAVEEQLTKSSTLSPRKFTDAMTTFNLHCSEELVRSCLEDLTALATHTTDGKLLFHHASFSDYVVDPSRSENYFVDIAGLSSVIVSNIWKQVGYPPHEMRNSKGRLMGLCFIMRMTSLPPGLMSILAPILANWETTMEAPYMDRIFPVLVHLGNLCIGDEDITEFRRLMREWLCVDRLIVLRHHFRVIKTIRFGHRYVQMARAEDFAAPDDKMTAALRPRSDFDRRESALWLRDLLRRIRREEYTAYNYNERPEQLLDAWTSWAVSYGIPLDTPEINRLELKEIKVTRYSARYTQMARAARFVAPDDKMAVALRPESDFDRQELTIWLNGLLDQIFTEVYPIDTAQYRELLKAWIFWGVLHDIRLGGGLDTPNFEGTRQSVNLPYSHRYLVMARADYRQIPDGELTDILCPESDFDRQELAIWLNDLLDQIYRDIYPTDAAHYKRLLKGWISWAVRHNIPLDSPESEVNQISVDMPYRRWYLVMDRTNYHHTPDNRMAAALCPRSDSDRQELVLWFHGILDQIHREIYPHNTALYKRLLGAWILWAIKNDVLVDLCAPQYIFRGMALKWAAPKLKLGGKK